MNLGGVGRNMPCIMAFKYAFDYFPWYNGPKNMKIHVRKKGSSKERKQNLKYLKG